MATAIPRSCSRPSAAGEPIASFARQRDWAIEQVPARYDWQFHLDADERFTPELLAEIAAEVARGPAVGGYLVANKLMLGDRWLRYAGQYPTYQVRLFHLRRLRFVDHGHCQREHADYPLGRLQQPYLHHAFSKGPDTSWRSLFSRDATARRRALKRLSYRLPGRYFLRLTYLLLVRRAFLDGSAGWTYAHILATYEAMVAIQMRVLRGGYQP